MRVLWAALLWICAGCAATLDDQAGGLLQWYTYSLFAIRQILRHNFRTYLELHGGSKLPVGASGRFEAMETTIVQGLNGKAVRANPLQNGSWGKDTWDFIVVDGGRGATQVSTVKQPFILYVQQ
jgi:hypothetical protein